MKSKPCPKRCCPCGTKPGNPGTFEELHKKINDLNAHNFDGLRVLVKNCLSKYFRVDHNITMSNIAPSGYKFCAQYIGTKKVGRLERYPLLYGELTPSGDLMGKIEHNLSCRSRVKMSTFIHKGKYKMLQATADYRTDDSTFSATLVDPVILKAEGTLLLQYLQALSPRLTVGTEIACYKTPKAPGGKLTNVAGAFRYSTGIQTLSATAGPAGLRLCYHSRASNQLQIGVELLSNFHFKETKAAILYRLDLPYADLIFKGFINSQWSIGAVLEKKLRPMPGASLILSTLLNHNKKFVRVGIGLNIEK